jgi:hypothetical protein
MRHEGLFHRAVRQERGLYCWENEVGLGFCSGAGDRDRTRMTSLEEYVRLPHKVPVNALKYKVFGRSLSCDRQFR